MWVAIDGYKYPYRVNEHAVIQKQKETGEWVEISQWVSGHIVVVNLRTTDGKQKRITVSTIMDKAFFGGIVKREGLKMRHKNRIITDCSVWNLEPITPSDLGVIYGKLSGRMPVVRRWRGTEILYKSKTEAARRNGLTRNSLDRRISGQVQDPRGYQFFILEKRGLRGRPKKEDCA